MIPLICKTTSKTSHQMLNVLDKHTNTATHTRGSYHDAKSVYLGRSVVTSLDRTGCLQSRIIRTTTRVRHLLRGSRLVYPVSAARACIRRRSRRSANHQRRATHTVTVRRKYTVVTTLQIQSHLVKELRHWGVRKQRSRCCSCSFERYWDNINDCSSCVK